MGKSGVFFMEPDPWFNSTSDKIDAFKPGITFDNEPGGFAENKSSEYTQEMTGEHLGQIRGQTSTVGRPTNGIVAKPNTHAFVQVLGPDGKVIQCFNNIGRKFTTSQSGYYLQDRVLGDREEFDPFGALKGSFSSSGLDSLWGGGDDPPADTGADSSGNLADTWTDWILQSVQESRIEKTQVVETFGDSYFYAFGQRPRSIQISGLLMNTTDYNWRAVFWKNWDEFFRATKLVERGARLYLQWDEIIVEGYPINAVCSEVADSPNAMKFNFQLFVTRYINLSAQSGFLTQRYMRIAQLRAGSGLGMVDKTYGYRLMGGESFEPRSFNYIKPSTGFMGSMGGGLFGMEGLLGLRMGTGAQYQKFSLLGQLGPQLGNLTKKLLLQIPGAREVVENTEIGASVLRNAGYAANALQKALWLGGRDDPAIANQFMQNWARSTSRDLVASLARDVTNLADDALGVRRGEIDQMFGYFGEMVDDLKSETRAGGKFKLSPSAKVSSAQRFAVNLISPEIHSPEGSSYGEQPGGIIIIDEDGTNITDVVDDIDF